jgi:hypothetical protein
VQFDSTFASAIGASGSVMLRSAIANARGELDLVDAVAAQKCIPWRAASRVALAGGQQTSVKDRFEVGFDYIPMQAAIAGKPLFKNAASTVSAVYEGVCRQPEVAGAYEHLDVVDAKPARGSIELTIKRTFPSGGIPFVNEEGKCGLRPAAAKIDTVTHTIPVIPGTFFGTPALAPKHVLIGESASETNTVTIGKDQKTIVVVDEKGWKYTYTLRIAK